MCEKWGSVTRGMIYGVNGWPAKTMLGRIMEEGFTGAAAKCFVQHFPEVMTGDSLAVSNAFKNIRREEVRLVVFAHYVIPKKAHEKARRMGICRTTYYDRLKDGHSQLLSLLSNEQKPAYSVRD